MLAVQAWEKEAAAEHGALTSEQKWEAGAPAGDITGGSRVC